MKKKYLIFSILLIIYSCKENSTFKVNEQNVLHYNCSKEIDFLKDDFKVVLDSFIANTSVYPINQYKDVLIYLDKENNDTILKIENCPPFERSSLQSIFTYKDFYLYCYVQEDLDHKLNTLIKSNDKRQIEYGNVEIDTTEIDVIYRATYIINGEKIELRKIPLEWSTDSN